MRSLTRSVVVAVSLLVAAASPVSAVASPYTFSDPAGDAPKGIATDVRKVTLTHATTVKVAIKMGKANPFSSWSTAGNPASIGAAFLPGGRYIFAGKVSAALFEGETQVPGCPVTRKRNATTNTYTFSVARSCLGNPKSIQVQVTVEPMGITGPGDIDHAPDSGYSAKVSF
jgi:hypothetical protein